MKTHDLKASKSKRHLIDGTVSCDEKTFYSIGHRSSRRRSRRSKSVSPEETSKFSTFSSDEDDDDFSVAERRGSSFSISSLASRSSTLSRIFKPRKKSFSNNSLTDDFTTKFPDFYVSKQSTTATSTMTSLSSPSTPISRTSSTLSRPKFSFRRDSLDRRSTRASTSASKESLDEDDQPRSGNNNNGKLNCFHFKILHTKQNLCLYYLPSR